MKTILLLIISNVFMNLAWYQITFISVHLCPNGPEVRRREAAYLAVNAAPDKLTLITRRLQLGITARSGTRRLADTRPASPGALSRR